MIFRRLITIAALIVVLLQLSLIGQTLNLKEPKVNYAGKLVFTEHSRDFNGIKSENGQFTAVPLMKRTVGHIEYSDIQISGNNKILFSVNNVLNIPQISNKGYLMAQKFEKRGELNPSLVCYNQSGEKVTTRTYSEAVELLGFNFAGDFYGIGTSASLEVINCTDGSISSYTKGYCYSISEDGNVVAVASRMDEKSIITISIDGVNRGVVPLELLSVRSMAISEDKKLLAAVDRDNFTIIDISSLKIVKSESVASKPGLSFVDVHISDNKIWVGLQKNNADHSSFQGILQSYNLEGELLNISNGSKRAKEIKRLNYRYKDNEFPWPFEPQDEAHTVWNGYLALTGSSNSSNGAYLHQGLDIDVPANEPTVSISYGFCKARLYIMDPSYLYWRVCIADEDVNTATDGWMYAHLVENTIMVSVDDTVYVGQDIGDIIKWDALSSWGNERGHIHFSRINDHGVQWSYTDDQWKNVCDPLYLLRPFGDTIPPQFLDNGDGSAFKFSTNEGSGYVNYLQPSNLSGDVDIIVYMTDKAGNSKWWQPASRIFWWIKSDFSGDTVKARTTGLHKNQKMPDYTGSLYTSTLPPVMFRMDYECSMNSSWTTTNRTYYHIVTNNDGDSIVEASDKSEALKTAEFGDGDYWIFVELQDVAGNIAVDSQLVTFNNGIVALDKENLINKSGVQIRQNTNFINLSNLSGDGIVKIFNLKGAQIAAFKAKSSVLNINKRKFGKGMFIFNISNNNKSIKKAITIH